MRERLFRIGGGRGKQQLSLHPTDSRAADPTRRHEGRQVFKGQLSDAIDAEFLQYGDRRPYAVNLREESGRLGRPSVWFSIQFHTHTPVDVNNLAVNMHPPSL
jgi:hypothetical protein